MKFNIVTIDGSLRKEDVLMVAAHWNLLVELIAHICEPDSLDCGL